MDPNMVTTVLVAAGTALGTNALAKAEGPAQAIDDLMEIVGFGKLTEFADKRRALRKVNNQKYIDEIVDGMRSIEPDNFQEPKISILGPALEASKYYIDDETLRSMFSKLVSSCIDSSKNDMVHESYVEIIKQLSTTDAKHIQQIYSQENNPIVEYRWRDKENKEVYRVIAEYVYKSNHLPFENAKEINASLVNLQRLGLIKLDSNFTYQDQTVYNDILNSPFSDYVINLIHDELSGHRQINKGMIILTTFGSNFCKVCL